MNNQLEGCVAHEHAHGSAPPLAYSHAGATGASVKSYVSGRPAWGVAENCAQEKGGRASPPPVVGPLTIHASCAAHVEAAGGKAGRM